MAIPANTMKRPYVLIKTAMSLNGKIGSRAKKRIVLSNKEDMRTVDALRGKYDAILVGKTTIKKDNPRLVLKFSEHTRARLTRGLPKHPVKVTLSTLCDLNPRSSFFTAGDAEKFVFTTNLALTKNIKRINAHARVFRAGEKRVNIKKMLATLYKHGIRKLMVEGGGRTNYEFLKANCVDELRVAVAPIIIGEADAPTIAYGNNLLRTLNFNLKSAERLGEMVVLRYDMIKQT